jgi:hypothetical protein
MGGSLRAQGVVLLVCGAGRLVREGLPGTSDGTAYEAAKNTC